MDNKKSLYYLRAIQGHSGGKPKKPEMMEYTLILYKWMEYIFHKGISWNSQSILGSGLIPGGKENDKARQAVFCTPLDPFGSDPNEEKPDDDYIVSQRVHYQTCWKHNQVAVSWIKLFRAQDQGLPFWHIKSFAIIIYATVPGDCIYRVISQSGDRVPHETLATPRPAPKATLKSNWHTQQQQQRTLREGANSISKEIATWESKAGVRDETKNSTEVERCILKQRSEYSRNRTSVNWFEQNLYSRRPS